MYSFWKRTANGFLVVDREAMAKTKEFKDVATRKYPIPSDSDGRKKLMNERELMFIYYYCDETLDNPLVELSGRDRLIAAKEKSELSPTWKMDSVVQAAVKAYKLLHPSKEFKVIIALETQLMNYTSVLDTLSNSFNKELQKLNELLKDDTLEIKKATSIQNLLQSVISNLKAIKDLTKDIPDIVDSITAAKVRIRGQQLKEEQKIYGGGKAYDYENPNG